MTLSLSLSLSLSHLSLSELNKFLKINISFFLNDGEGGLANARRSREGRGEKA